jgi:hypothetical protein
MSKKLNGLLDECEDEELNRIQAQSKAQDKNSKNSNEQENDQVYD